MFIQMDLQWIFRLMAVTLLSLMLNSLLSISAQAIELRAVEDEHATRLNDLRGPDRIDQLVLIYSSKQSLRLIVDYGEDAIAFEKCTVAKGTEEERCQKLGPGWLPETYFMRFEEPLRGGITFIRQFRVDPGVAVEENSNLRSRLINWLNGDQPSERDQAISLLASLFTKAEGELILHRSISDQPLHVRSNQLVEDLSQVIDESTAMGELPFERASDL